MVNRVIMGLIKKYHAWWYFFIKLARPEGFEPAVF